MTRLQLIRRILRQVYGGQPSVDSNITDGLVNNWLSDAIADAAKRNYVENNQLDGISYVNNSFYTTFKNISISQYEPFIFQMTLPEVPVGLGYNEGIGTLQFVDNNGNISDPAIPLSENQVGYYRSLRPVPNKILYYSEGIFLYALTDLQLDQYKAKARMISGGDSTDLNSIINVPPDYFPAMTEYISKQLSWERQQPKIPTDDGSDA